MNFLTILLAGAVFFLSLSFLSTRIKPMTGTRKKRTMEAYNSFSKFERKKKVDKIKEKIYTYLDKISKIQLSTYKRDKLNCIIDRLNIDDLTPERILSQQVYSVLYYSFIAFMLMTLVFIRPYNIYLGLFVEAYALLTYKLKLYDYESKIKEKDEHIMDDLFSFYSVLCSTYQKSYDTPPEEIVNNFIKSANSDMKEELTILLINIKSVGAVKAFMIFKHRVPLPYVLRVCDTLITRFSTATDNTSTMLYLKEELKKLRYIKLDQILEKKVAKVEKAQFVIVIIVVIFAGLHFYFQSFSSFKMIFS